MKRKLFAGFLAVVLVLSLLPTAALAQETGTTVGNIDLTNYTTDTCGTGWRWEAGTKTLTLSGVNISVSSGDAISLPDGAIIVLADNTTNVIVNTGKGNSISGGEHLTIRGGSTAKTGELSITNKDNTVHAIMTKAAASGDCSGLSIADCKLTITGGNNGIRVGDDKSAVSEAYLSIQNSDIEVASVSAIGVRLQQIGSNGTTKVSIVGSTLDVSTPSNDAMRLVSKNNSQLLIEGSTVSCVSSSSGNNRNGIRFQNDASGEENRKTKIKIKNSSVCAQGQNHGVQVRANEVNLEIENSIFTPITFNEWNCQGLFLDGVTTQTASILNSVVYARGAVPYDWNNGDKGDPPSSWSLTNSTLFRKGSGDEGKVRVWNNEAVLSQNWTIPSGNDLHIEAGKSLTLNSDKTLTFDTENTLMLKGGTLKLNGGSVNRLTYESGTIETTQAIAQNINLTTQSTTNTIVKGTNGYTLTQDDLAKLSLTKVVGENDSDVTDSYALYLDTTNNKIVQKERSVSVAFDSNGGTGVMPAQKVPKGEATALNPNSFTKIGYTFSGWSIHSSGGGIAYTNGANITTSSNMTLYAQWTPNQYAITYELNGGTAGADAPAKHTYGTDTTLVAPTKTGYTFGGWYTDESMVNVVSDNKLAGNGYIADIKLYAKWIPNTYTVQFHANGGEGTMDNQSMTYDAPASLAASSFTKPGYNFAGWDTDESADEVVYSDKTQVENLTATNGETVNLYAVWTPKKVCNPDVSVQTKTYNSKAQAFTLDDYNISYIQGDQIIENPIDAGSYDVVITRDEDETYAAYSTTVSGGLVINPQALIIKANDQSVRVGNALPEFSYTVTGLCCEDELSTEPAMTCTAADANTTGTYTITPSGADAGSNYTIVYEDGTLTVYKKHKSKSSDTDETNTDDKDNSGTTTVTDDKTGTVTETIKNTDGSTTVIETQKDGTVTTTEIAKTGVKTVTVAKPDENVKASVTLPSGVTSAKVTVPVKANSGTVAVDAKTGEVIKLSIPADDGLSLKLDNSADLIVMNKSRNFADTKGHWALNGIDFATSHELFAGTGSETFEPDNSMTRAMLMTVLARFDGEDTNGGATWYEKSMGWAKGKGISDGSDPNGSITREELATMMWRYAGSPAVSGDLSKFSDSKNISAYAKDALIWAASEGLITGTTNDTIAPQGDATRAQVATIFMRYVKNLID